MGRVERTEAQRFGINEDILVKCRICKKKPIIDSVCHGHGDFGPSIKCRGCGITVEPYLWDLGRAEKQWNRLMENN